MTSPTTHGHDVGGIRRREAEDEVGEAGVARLVDRAPRRARVVVGDGQVDRADDLAGVAADLGAVAVQQRAAPDDVVDVAARDVPHVGVLGDHPQRRRRAPADHDRRVRALDRLRVAEGPGELDVRRRRSRTARSRSRGAGSRCTPRRGCARSASKSWNGRPCASYSRRAIGWLGREPAPIPKSSRPPDTTSTVAAILASIAGGRKRLLVTSRPSRSRSRLRGQRRQQRPALEGRPGRVAADRHQVVEQPRVLDLRDRVRLPPDPQEVVVVDLHRRGHQTEAGTGHGAPR